MPEKLISGFFYYLDPPFLVDEIGFEPVKVEVSTEDLFKKMKKGTAMKFYYKSKRPIVRMIRLSEEENILYIGTKDYAILEFVREIRKGQKTQVFMSKRNQDPSVANTSFSLIYQNNTSYNFSAPNEGLQFNNC